MAKKILVTSALPYANGPIHIGHLVEEDGRAVAVGGPDRRKTPASALVGVHCEGEAELAQVVLADGRARPVRSSWG